MAATPTTPAAAQKSGMAKIIKFLTKNSMTIALIAVFVLFYPNLAGLPVASGILRSWLPTWPF